MLMTRLVVCSHLHVCFTEKQLATYAEWHAPRAGMFLWLRLKHVEDSMDIFEELKEAKVVVVPGKEILHMLIF